VVVDVPNVAYDLRHLKYALLVAEHGSFPRAADAINVSQSTLSRRVQILEQRVGISLFERSRTGAQPTDAGQIFLRDASIGAEYKKSTVKGLICLDGTSDSGGDQYGRDPSRRPLKLISTCLIRQRFALLIPRGNFDNPRFARFQRLSVSIARLS
jgi:Bacterial regulatory helix-turn-helix protein, lysR family